MTGTTIRLGWSYRCRLGETGCDRGSTKPLRERCRRCGSKLDVERGLYGTFHHRGDGRYPLRDAVSVHASAKVAQGYVDRHADQGLVVRFVALEPELDGAPRAEVLA